jgi:predicted glycosyltransferase
MRIVVDINHPAHVHYFKNFIWEMERRGHEILITASHKDVATELLHRYNLPFIDLGSYGSSLVNKILNLPIMDILDDTEHAKWEHGLYVPFADTILTPSCFHKDLGEKQIRFDSYMELGALHPNNFKPDPSVLREFGISEQDQFFILRFISWDANHDVGQEGLKDKIELVRALEPFGRVLITSEGEMPGEFEPYRIRVSPDKLHDLLAYATLYIGEGATTASESAMLGTHAVYVNSLGTGYISELEERYGLVRSISDPSHMGEDVIRLVIIMLETPALLNNGAEKRDRVLRDKIDLTAFLVWVVENYPHSVEELKADPGIQRRFIAVPGENV